MMTTPSTPVSELMSNLHVSVSEESTNSSDPKSIAISTARIFRGIVVDGNGVITSMNSRAMKSARNAAKNGTGNDPRNKMGEKSRQAAKIDKAKDLIDEVVENGGTGSAMSDVSLFYCTLKFGIFCILLFQRSHCNVFSNNNAIIIPTIRRRMIHQKSLVSSLWASMKN